jgi:hypothetical protein
VGKENTNGMEMMELSRLDRAIEQFAGKLDDVRWPLGYVVGVSGQLDYTPTGGS